MRILIAIIASLAWANLAFGGDYVVVNKTESKQRFTVVNKTKQYSTVKTVGCVCSKGYNCSAGFCKANGGTGCPNTCPINGVKETIVAQSSVQTTKSIDYGYSNCPNGNCASPSFQRGSWYPGKLIGR